MHRTTGDSFGTSGAKRVFRQEDPGGSFSATQLDYTMMNAIQEEIATVIEAQGLTLHTDAEPLSDMNQLNTAIDSKLVNPLKVVTSGNSQVARTKDALLENILSYMSALMVDHISGLHLQYVDADNLIITKGTAGVNNLTNRNEPYIFHQNVNTQKTLALWLTTGLTPAVNTWYHFFICVQPGGTTGNWTIKADTSSTGANILSGTSFTVLRRIGSIRTDHNGDIWKFLQNGDKFLYENGSTQTLYAPGYIDVSPVSASATRIALNQVTDSWGTLIPKDISVEALLTLQVDISAANTYFYYWDGVLDNIPTNKGDLRFLKAYTANQEFSISDSVLLNSSSELSVIKVGAGTVNLQIRVYGWIDPRGRTN